MNFFFDANISRRYARMIHEMHEKTHEVVHITDHKDFLHNNLPQGGNSTKDVEWLEKLGKSEKGWKVISGESNIIDIPHERAALINAKLTFFSMDHNWAKLGFHDQAWKIVKIWNEVLRLASIPEPKLFRIHMGKKMYIEEIKTEMRARGGKFRE